MSTKYISTPFIICLLLQFLFLKHAFGNETRPLSFGFLPSRSTVSLTQHFAPLRDYLASRLNREVFLETSPDYPSFIKDTNNRKFDFVLTAPHFALLALDSGKYIAPVTYNSALKADILINSDSPIKDIKQLAGKKISIPPETAIISTAAKLYLMEKGLKGKMAPRYIVTNSHNASVHSMLGRDTVAAIASFNVTRQFNKRQAPLKKLASTGPLPGMAFLVARDLPESLQKQFTQTLISMHKTKDGKPALKTMGYPGYRLSRKNEFETARPYLRLQKR